MNGWLAKLLVGIVGLGSLILMCSPAWAEDRVLNIYFAGTGNTVHGSHYFDDFGISIPKFDDELISELYANDESGESLSGAGPHFKTFVDGIGSTITTLANQVDPALPGRGWVECLDEARSAFTTVAGGSDDQIILNLIGFSRGGVLTMIMARWASDSDLQSKIKKINILAYDPVPGYPLGDPLYWLESNTSLPDHILSLSDKVHQFVAIYATHERSIRFEPVIPEWDSENTRVLLLMLPGSHETLIGNTENDGHAGVPFLNPDETGPELVHVSRISRLIAEHLLSGEYWGTVTFASPLYSEADIEAGFLNEIALMDTPELSNLYKNMIDTSFTILFQGVDLNYLTLNRDHQLLLPVIYPENYLLFLSSRWAYVSPYRHAFEIVWRPFPQLPRIFVDPNQVYNLYGEVNPINDADDWEEINSFRQEPTIPDTEAPEPNLPSLANIIGECAVEITNPPKATDNVDGLVIGVSSDPLSYTELGSYFVTWTCTDEAVSATGSTSGSIPQ